MGYKKEVEEKNIGGTEEEYNRFRQLLKLIFTICELCGFHLEGRISVKDMKTGKVWK